MALRRTLNDAGIGSTVVVTQIGSSGAMRRRLIEMGITPGVKIKIKKVAPLGDPIEINLRGYELTIRRTEAKEIYIEKEKQL